MSEQQPDPLVMPADEFAAVKTVAEAAGEQPWTPEQVAEFKVRFEATMARYAPLRVLPSDHWKDRAEAAEAKLAVITAWANRGGVIDSSAVLAAVAAETPAALAVIGSEEEEAPAPDIGHLSAADRAMVARITGGGIRNREMRVEFSDEEPGDGD